MALFASYSYHAFITDRDGDTLELEADHRRHAEIENAIRDLKYGVGLNHLPCGNESPFAIYTDEPAQVAGCSDCLELVAEDLKDLDTQHGGYCLHCRREITATGSVEWRRVVRRPCPHCGKPGW